MFIPVWSTMPEHIVRKMAAAVISTLIWIKQLEISKQKLLKGKITIKITQLHCCHLQWYKYKVNLLLLQYKACLILSNPCSLKDRFSSEIQAMIYEDSTKSPLDQPGVNYTETLLLDTYSNKSRLPSWSHNWLVSWFQSVCWGCQKSTQRSASISEGAFRHKW